MTTSARPIDALSTVASPVASPSTELRVRNLSITHEGATEPTPREVSFTVSPGEVVLVLGPSGSGKSTLTLALNGLIPHAVPAEMTGTVQVGSLLTSGSTVATLSTHVAMVFQDPDSQLVTGRLFDEVAFGPENLRLPVDVVLARTEAALRSVGLWERHGENPERLSGGGRQRLAIACALAMGSPILVLDEPTANLDPAGIEDVYAALQEVVAGGDHGIVLVEHNLDAAIGFVDRVVALDGEGRLVAEGPVDEVLRSRAAELVELGVWLPTSTLAAMRLREAGYGLEPLPLSPDELRAALERSPAPAALVAGRDVVAAEGAAVEAGGAAASTPLIAVRDLSVKRGRTTLLHNIDLDIAAGEFVAVVGANGAGKTTLIQAIAGVVPPPRGKVRVADLDPGRADVATLASRVGFVFQNPEHQFVTHTVFDELAQGLRLRHTPEAEVTRRVAEMLERFGLEGREETHPFRLSGGQKRRLSVGTALIAGAPVLALDEPTFGQDRARADELLSILKDLNETGTTVLVVTHDMQLVAEYATRTAVLRDGRLVAYGPTAEILADAALIESVGLRVPPLAHALAGIPGHPELDGIVRLSDLPSGPRS